MSSQQKPPPPPGPRPGTRLPPAGSSTTEAGRVQTLEQMVRSINEKIQHAEVLNGGFTELKNKVDDIRTTQIKMDMELKSVRAGEIQLKEKVDEINDAIYDPDNGIYRRINESVVLDKQRDEKLDLAVQELKNVQVDLAPIEKTDEDLKKIAGEDLKELQSIVKTRQIIDRMFWIMLTALVGGGVKLLWDFISSWNS